MTGLPPSSAFRFTRRHLNGTLLDGRRIKMIGGGEANKYTTLISYVLYLINLLRAVCAISFPGIAHILKIISKE